MWIFLSDAFLSVVQHRLNPEMMMVRARLNGDLERVFPNESVTETPGADYRFRITIHKADLKLAILREIDRIDYDNFKGSVDPADPVRHDAYFDVWSAMNRAQYQ